MISLLKIYGAKLNAFACFDVNLRFGVILFNWMLSFTFQVDIAAGGWHSTALTDNGEVDLFSSIHIVHSYSPTKEIVIKSVIPNLSHSDRMIGQSF